MNDGAVCKGLTVIAWMFALQVNAFARCPPARDAELVAAGGAIVSGRIITAGSLADDSQSQWARLEVTERRAGSAPSIVRLRAVNAGIYTLQFAVGTTGSLAIRRPFGESGVTACDTRGP